MTEDTVEKLLAEVAAMDQSDETSGEAAYERARPLMSELGLTFSGVLQNSVEAVPAAQAEKIRKENERLRQQNTALSDKERELQKSLEEVAEKTRKFSEIKENKNLIVTVASTFTLAAILMLSVNRCNDSKQAQEKEDAQAAALDSRVEELRQKVIKDLDGKKLLVFKDLAHCIENGYTREECACSRDKAHAWKPREIAAKEKNIQGVTDNSPSTYTAWVATGDNICKTTYPLKDYTMTNEGDSTTTINKKVALFIDGRTGFYYTTDTTWIGKGKNPGQLNLRAWTK